MVEVADAAVTSVAVNGPWWSENHASVTKLDRLGQHGSGIERALSRHQHKVALLVLDVLVGKAQVRYVFVLLLDGALRNPRDHTRVFQHSH